MNGLVGYGSSDDEEGEAAEDALPDNVQVDADPRMTNASNGSSSNNVHDSLHVSQHAVNNHVRDEVLMVGPRMPTDAGAILQSHDEDETVDLPKIPEQDLLRYLTQPTYPTDTLPPEPTAAADPSVTAKLRKFVEFKSKGIHFNQDLASKTSFRNPNLFASLLERSGLPPEAQYASTLSAAVLSIDTLPLWAYKEALHEKQKSLTADHAAAKKAQSAGGKRTIDFLPASRESTPGTQKRKRT